MAPTPRKTVLIVEDEAALRMIGVDILEDGGFRVIEAANAAEALAQLEHDTEVLVMFTDVNMPGAVDGLALAKLVNDRWPHIKVLVASGNVRPGPLDLPKDGVFLSKPYLAADLLAVVRGLSAAT